jgi:hypothetical protein
MEEETCYSRRRELKQDFSSNRKTGNLLDIDHHDEN